VVTIAATRNYSGVECIAEHIPVVISVSYREDSLMFAKSSVLLRGELSCIIGLRRRTSETLSLFLGADVSDN